MGLGVCLHRVSIHSGTIERVDAPSLSPGQIGCREYGGPKQQMRDSLRFLWTGLKEQDEDRSATKELHIDREVPRMIKASLNRWSIWRQKVVDKQEVCPDGVMARSQQTQPLVPKGSITQVWRNLGIESQHHGIEWDNTSNATSEEKGKVPKIASEGRLVLRRSWQWEFSVQNKHD